MTVERKFDRTKVRLMARDGYTAREIAMELGANVSHIYAIGVEEGITFVNSYYTGTANPAKRKGKVDLEKVRIMAEEGHDAYVIGERLNLHPFSVHRIARDNGFTVARRRTGKRTNAEILSGAPIPALPKPQPDLSPIRPFMFSLANYDPVVRRALRQRIRELREKMGEEAVANLPQVALEVQDSFED